MFTFPVRVYYSDTDCSGIVYHARYLDFAEHARTEMFRQIGGDQRALMEESGMYFVVKSITIDYQRPGKLDDQLIVECKVVEAKHFSIVLSQSVKRGDEVLAELTVKIASISGKTLRPLAIDQKIVDAMMAL